MLVNADDFVDGFHGTGLSEESYEAWRRNLRSRCAYSRRVRYQPGLGHVRPEQMLGRHRHECEVMALIYIEEVARDLVVGTRSFEESVNMGVRIIRQGVRVGRERPDDVAVRLAVVTLLEWELGLPKNGFYYVDDGLVRFQEVWRRRR